MPHDKKEGRHTQECNGVAKLYVNNAIMRINSDDLCRTLGVLRDD